MVGKEIVPIGHDLVMQGGKMDENGDLPTEKHDTLWLFNIAMENGPFADDFPSKTSIYNGFSIAMLNKQMVKHWDTVHIGNIYIYDYHGIYYITNDTGIWLVV